MTADIHYLNLLEVSDLIRRRALSARAVCETLIARIERLDGGLHAVTQVLTDSALAEADKADREIAAGLWRGPLHGVPIGIKDLLDIGGTSSGCGGALFRDKLAPVDATAVRRLRQAGAVIIAKLHMTEGATLSHHPDLPRPENPWKAGYWPGVSSSGSGVAVAAGFCYAALGTDTGGSIRMPSTACGLSGLKPTWGRVSRHGLFPLAESFDHLGPMARTAADAAAVLQALAGVDALDPTTLPAPVPDYLAGLGGNISGLVIGVDRSLIEAEVDPPVSAAVNSALGVLQSLGARLQEIKLPDFALLSPQITPLVIAEVAAAHAETYPAQADHYGPGLRRMLDAGLRRPAVDLARAVHARAAFCGRIRLAFEDVDLLVTPGAPQPTPTWAEVEAFGEDTVALMARVARYTTPFNATGSPTLSLPCGLGPAGLPLG
ncbi:MAG: amidase, partial [Caulobacteraceae bacterium]|nr:amidase [Caulobacteraceae bacterium]